MKFGNSITRRSAIQTLAVAGSVPVIGTSVSASGGGKNSDIEDYIHKLIDRHGNFEIGRGWFLDNNEIIVDTAGNRYSGDSRNYTPDSVRFIQRLHFEDGYRTLVETRLELDSEQTAAVMSSDQNPSGTASLVNKVEGKEFQNEFDFETYERKAQEAAEEVSSIPTSPTTSSSTSEGPSASSSYWTTYRSDDGTEDLDHGLPVLNSVGANYKTGDNRCGVAQRSAYLTLNAGATAEVYRTEYFSDDMSDATVTYTGDIQGVISSIGMGGFVQAEGFVRNTDTGNEASTLLMNANVGIAELPFVTGNGDVDGRFGPGNGAVGDQSYLNYELNTDIESGTVEIGVRMKVAFNGLKGGVTQTNFMPARQWQQPKGLGTEFSSITIKY
jgi:hypothetical protein